MKKSPLLKLLGIVAAAAALAGAAFGVWKLIQHKRTCRERQEDLPDFSEDFDLDDEDAEEDFDEEASDSHPEDPDDIDLDIHVDGEEKPEA